MTALRHNASTHATEPVAAGRHLLRSHILAMVSEGTAEPRVLPRAEHPISRKDISANALKVLYRLHQRGH